MNIFIRILMMLYLILSCNSSDNIRNDLIATVGSRTLSANSFKFKYIDYLNKLGLDDQIHYRNQFLDNEINRLVILNLVDSLTENQILELSKLTSLIKSQLISDEFFYREILENYHPSDSLLREMFIRSKTEVRARHIHAKSLEEANRFKIKLSNGISFTELAKTTFQDSILSQNGGDLGYFSFGDLEPEFENVAFSLNEGEISDPIKTRFGYSIIQLIDRWIEPIITEDDFQLHKHELITILRQRSAQLLRKTYVENLIKEIKFNISDNHIQLLYGNLTEALLDKSHFSLPIKLTSNNVIWNYEDIIYRLNNLSIQHLNRINSKSDLLEVLKGIFVREQIAQNAKNKEWFNRDVFQNQLIRRSEDKMIKYLVDLYKTKNSSWKDSYNLVITKNKPNFPIVINHKKIESILISS